MKVFCIGFNKTGTSSLHALFEAMGLRSFHGAYADVVRPPDFADPMYTRYDCFSDGERHDFRALDRSFPDARFILLTRGLEDWLVSRLKHVHIRERRGRTGWMWKEYTEDAVGAPVRWIERRRVYHDDVRAYFRDRPDRFREWNVCDATPAQQQRIVDELHGFLGVEEKGLAFPRDNPSEKRAVWDLPTLWRWIRGRPVVPDYDEDALRAEARRALEAAGVPREDWQSDR